MTFCNYKNDFTHSLLSTMNIFLLVFSLCALIKGLIAITVISKSEWGGRAASSEMALQNNLSYVIVHHSAGHQCNNQTTCSAQMRNMQTYHMLTLDWPDIGYNFAIGGDGNIYEGRGVGVVGAHAYGWNSKSYGIVFIGNYNDFMPTTAQKTKAQDLIEWLVSQSFLAANYTLYGHRQVRATECPGNNLFGEVKSWPQWKELVKQKMP